MALGLDAGDAVGGFVVDQLVAFGFKHVLAAQLHIVRDEALIILVHHRVLAGGNVHAVVAPFLGRGDGNILLLAAVGVGAEAAGGVVEQEAVVIVEPVGRLAGILQERLDDLHLRVAFDIFGPGREQLVVVHVVLAVVILQLVLGRLMDMGSPVKAPVPP